MEFSNKVSLQTREGMDKRRHMWRRDVDVAGLLEQSGLPHRVDFQIIKAQ